MFVMYNDWNKSELFVQVFKQSYTLQQAVSFVAWRRWQWRIAPVLGYSFHLLKVTEKSVW